MTKRELKKGLTSFIKAEKLGECPYCPNEVFSDQLYVEEDGKVYHYSCYNYKVADEKK